MDLPTDMEILDRLKKIQAGSKSATYITTEIIIRIGKITYEMKN